MTTALNVKMWKGLPWGLLGVSLIGWGYMASLAVKDPGFSLERDYYRKATAWDHEQSQRATNARLGWILATAQTASGVEIGLEEANGTAMRGASGEVEAFAIARAANVQTTPLREVGPGKYAADVRFLRAGLWELRVTIRKGTDTFTQTVRMDANLEKSP